jgi:antitoxin (DNA-binding transcriptional repressor) of toxin-antitoxin stability system
MHFYLPVWQRPMVELMRGTATTAGTTKRAGRFVRALENTKMVIYNSGMDISVTQFKHHCLEIIRRLEQTGAPVAITRRGKVVAQLRTPAVSRSGRAQKPWERLRAMGGRLLADPGESVIRDKDFEALR